MSWALCRAQLRCAHRRIAVAVAAAPLVAASAAGAAALLPALALWAGLRAAEPLRSALAVEPALARASALSVCVAAGLAGAVLAAVAPGAGVLGSQLAAAPLRPLTVVLGATVMPLGLAAVALSIPLVLFLAPSTRADTPSALASLAASAALGAGSAEAVIALGRRAWRGFALAGALASIAALDPSRGLAEALRGHASPVGPLVLALVATAVWVAAAAARPRGLDRSVTVRVLARGPFSAALVRCARAVELRRQAVAAVGSAAAGAVLLRVVGLPCPVVVLPAAATGVLGAALLPLAVAGLDRRAAWLMRSAPRPRRSPAAWSAAAGLVAGAVVAALAVAVTLAAAQRVPARAVALVPLTCVLFAAALLAGAIVPWRAGRLVEQLGSYAAFAVVAGGLSFGLARLAPVVHAESGVGAGLLAAPTLAACALAAVEIIGRAA